MARKTYYELLKELVALYDWAKPEERPKRRRIEHMARQMERHGLDVKTATVDQLRALEQGEYL